MNSEIMQQRILRDKAMIEQMEKSGLTAQMERTLQVTFIQTFTMKTSANFNDIFN